MLPAHLRAASSSNSTPPFGVSQAHSYSSPGASSSKGPKGTFEHREYRSSGLQVAMPSSSPPSQSQARAPSSLRQSRSADDQPEDELPHQSWTADDSPSPTDSYASTGASMSDSELDFDSPPRISIHPCTPTATSPSSPTSSARKAPASPSSSSSQTAGIAAPSHPYRRPARGLTPLSSLPAPPPSATGVLPKSQPLARALFARMADTPHAGMGCVSMGNKKAGGKQKMIVATKPMRTTFELGLSSSELARRA